MRVQMRGDEEMLRVALCIVIIGLWSGCGQCEFRETSIRQSYLSQSYTEKLQGNEKIVYKAIEEPKSNKAFFTEAFIIILSLFQ